MKVLRKTAPQELKLQELENFLLHNNMSIEWGFQGMEVTVDGWKFELKDIEGFETVEGLPRMLDSERMVFSE